MNQQIPDLEQISAEAKKLAADLSVFSKVRGGETMDMARAKWDYARQQARERGRQLQEKAKENILASMGLVAAVGFFIGMMLGRKRD